MDHDLSFDLHRLVMQLDRAADRFLREEYDVSYRRFLALVLIGELSSPTQRQLAEALGVTEPSVSRMCGVLVRSGLVDSSSPGGNRRLLALTPEGKDLVERCRELLERRFIDLLELGGVPYAAYARHTRRLLRALDSTGGTR